MKRFLLPFLLITSPAIAGDAPQPLVTMPTVMSLYQCNDEAFKELPKIAARLGVKPVSGDSKAGAMVLTMCDGSEYDFIEIINATLDRLDAAAKLAK